MATPFGMRDEDYSRWEGDGRSREDEERRYGREGGWGEGRRAGGEYGHDYWRRFGRDEDRGYGRDMGYGRDYGREGGMYGGGMGYGREGGMYGREMGGMYGREGGYGRNMGWSRDMGYGGGYGREPGRYGREMGWGGGFYGRDIGYGRDMGGVGPEQGGYGFGRGYGGWEERRTFEPRGRYGGMESRGWGEERGRGEHEGHGLMERMREGMRRLGGRGPRGYKRPDSRILEDVCEAIARTDIDAQNVDVAVNDGEVTLSGFVSERREKRALEDIAEDIFAVKEVHNRIRVSHGGMMGTERASSGAQGTGTAAAPSGTPSQPGHR